MYRSLLLRMIFSFPIIQQSLGEPDTHPFIGRWIPSLLCCCAEVFSFSPPVLLTHFVLLVLVMFNEPQGKSENQVAQQRQKCVSWSQSPLCTSVGPWGSLGAMLLAPGSAPCSTKGLPGSLLYYRSSFSLTRLTVCAVVSISFPPGQGLDQELGSDKPHYS